MPQLDYRHAVPVLGAWATKAHRFYDGTPGRELVTCPDCGRPADGMFGDHGWQCLDERKAGR